MIKDVEPFNIVVSVGELEDISDIQNTAYSSSTRTKKERSVMC